MFMMYIFGTFNPKHKTTLQATFETKKITLPDKTRIDLAIWDTAGQERFHSLGPIYYRGSKGAILVYDITDSNSFTRVQNWVKELKKMLGNEVVLVIVGNKLDLERNRVVSQKEAEQYAEEVGATHMSTSAKLNQGISEMFTELTKQIVAKDDGFKRTPSKPGGGLVIGDSKPAPTTSDNGPCC
uniref:Ras-related protein Rab-21 n=1 Tax=Arcella intermedia TaxID=1963864 RepID=A0A6B2LJ91_9EUKA